MDNQIQARLTWVKMYIETKDAGLVCRRCGISRPTLRKWFNRYQSNGLDGLKEHSRKPLTTPNIKLNEQIISWIIDLRKSRNIGARRIQSELIRLHECQLAVATIHKVLVKHNVKPLIKLKRHKQFKRYQRPTPGDRIQVDTCKIAPGIYQYTAY